MKVARFVLKIIAMSLTLAALVCAVIAYWDKLVELAQALCARIHGKRTYATPSEYDDYVE